MKGILLIVIGAIIAVLLGGVFLLRSNRSENPSISQKSVSSEIAPNYLKYSENNLAEAKANGRPVLYFWASWCPTCRLLDMELKERGNELPQDVTILQVNFDTERELKKRYRIVQQHTLVQIDNDGNEVTKWIGGNIDAIKQQLK